MKKLQEIFSQLKHKILYLKIKPSSNFFSMRKVKIIRKICVVIGEMCILYFSLNFLCFHSKKSSLFFFMDFDEIIKNLFSKSQPRNHLL